MSSEPAGADAQRFRDAFVAAALSLGEREAGQLLPEGVPAPAWANGAQTARARSLAAQLLRLRAALLEDSPWR